MKINLEKPLNFIPSIGEKRKKCFEKLGIRKVEDMLFFFPRKYLDLRNFKKISLLSPGEVASVKGKVIVREEKKIQKTPYLKVAISDGSGVLFLVFFNQLYLKNIFVPETEFFINGKVEVFRGELQMVNPIYEKAEEKRRWILPVYPLTTGLTQKIMRKVVEYILENLNEYPLEILPFSRRQKLGLPNIRFSLRNIHFPLSDINLEKARNYLVFREFFILQMRLLYRKMKQQQYPGNFENQSLLEASPIEKFESLLPFKLTRGQRSVMEDIIEDLRNGKVIQRLIQGEVGSGKTVVAVFALWLFAVSGYQGCLLVPTEILAEQHFLNWQEFFLKQNIGIALLVGQLSKREKNNIAEKIKEGEIKVVIGTHALLNQNINFRNLKMVVVDEQHKFGVRQREILKKKGEKPHYIVMSATPIPRSIALTLYGCLDFSTVGDLPAGERKVITYLFSKDEKEKIYHFIELQLKNKKQGFVVTPSIESEGIESAIEEFKILKDRFKKARISLIHGKMDFKEKEEIMEKFKKKDILLLVATSVIEAGIDVPEASYIVIMQAERFGLSQLHQLRGRVGRSGEIGYCLLVSFTDDEGINRRLETFVEKESGLEIAEFDLEYRGPGDLLGTRQHGIPPLKIGNIVSDMKFLNLARKEAERILTDDPELEKPQNRILKSIIFEEKEWKRK